VHDIAAGGLEVETLGGHVRGDQQPDRVADVVESLADLGALDE